MTANHSAPALYTAAEAAGILKVKQSWLEHQAAARKIPFTMLGGAFRFTADHLAAIVQMYERMPSPSDNARDSRSRWQKTRRPAQAAGNGVAPQRPRLPARIFSGLTHRSICGPAAGHAHRTSRAAHGRGEAVGPVVRDREPQR
jgi:excisionase family DNA binding protein